MRAGEVKHVAQIVDQQKAWLDLMSVAGTIHVHVDSPFHKLPHFISIIGRQKFCGVSMPVWKQSQFAGRVARLARNLAVAIFSISHSSFFHLPWDSSSMCIRDLCGECIKRMKNENGK